MTIITDVRFAHEDGALADTLSALHDLDVHVVSQTNTDPNQSVYPLRLEYDGTEDIEAVLEADHTVSDVVPMPEFENDRFWGVEFAAETKLLSPHVTTEGGFVLEAQSDQETTDPRGWYERWLLPDRAALQAIWRHAHDEGFEFEIVELSEHGRSDAEYPSADTLTDEQRETLIAAYEQGYFAEPRETSLEELAESFDRSASTIGGRINRGLKALIGAALVQKRSDR